MNSHELIQSLPPLVRVVGRHRPANQLVKEALDDERFSGILTSSLPTREPEDSPAGQDQTGPDASRRLFSLDSEFDYAQVDPALDVEPPQKGVPLTPPKAQVGYAGLTPPQRYRMLEWLAFPSQGAPTTIRQLYIAQLETALLDSEEISSQSRDRLMQLLESSPWHHNEGAGRALLLAFWLRRDGPGLNQWLAKGALAPSLVGLALGHLALLGQEISPATFGTLVAYWTDTRRSAERHALFSSQEFYALRLSSLKSSLQEGFLAFGLKQLSDAEQHPRPWRCSHRDLRIAIPQPDLTPYLKPLVREAMLVALSDESERQVVRDETDQRSSIQMGTLQGGTGQENREQNGAEEPQEVLDSPEDKPWNLVLEFGESRSEYFEFALFRARQRPGYSQILDENRKLVHRVVFTKPEMKHFWTLWEYVSKWSTVQVYLRGQEIEKDHVYRYSQYLV
ncbi:MAG: hypothetical protein AAF702_23300 [Chloroflexota bacterium]